MGSIIVDENLSSMMEKLSEKLNKKRYLHSLGVMDTAACLAMKYGCDIKKARYAGLLHDCAKNIESNRLIEKAEKYKIPLSDTERDNPDLLHAKIGKYVAKHDYGIADEEILNAIFYHTTGKPDMSLLEKIIFVSDYIEPNRTSDIPGILEIRNMAFTDIDRCVALICCNSLGYLKEKNAKIDKITEETFEYYKKYLKFKDRKESIIWHYLKKQSKL